MKRAWQPEPQLKRPGEREGGGFEVSPMTGLRAESLGSE